MESIRIAREDIVLSYEGFVNCRSSVGDFRELRDSIEQHGLLTPPLVWAVTDEDDNTKYVLIAGFRRLAALQELCEDNEELAEQYAEVNCSVYEGDLDGAIALNMVENVQRDDLNPADAADAVCRLAERLHTQEKVALALGKSQPWVSGYMALGRNLCSKAKTALRNEQITLAQAKELSKLSKKGIPNEEAQVQKLLQLLKPGSVEAATPKKEATNRSVKDVLDLRIKLVQDSEGTFVADADHADSLLTFIEWFLMTVSDEEVVERKSFDDEYATRILTEYAESTKPRGKGRPELSEEEKAEKAAAKAAAAEARKAEKAAAKEAEKQAKIAAKEAEKQAKIAAAEAKKNEALQKAEEKKQAAEKRAADKAAKEAAKAAASEAASAKAAATKPAKEAPKAEVRRALPVTPAAGRKLPTKK